MAKHEIFISSMSQASRREAHNTDDRGLRWLERRRIPAPESALFQRDKTIHETPVSRSARNFPRRVDLDREYLDIEQVAGMLRVNKQTASRLAREGKIPAFKDGRSWRFDPEELKELIEGDLE